MLKKLIRTLVITGFGTLFFVFMNILFVSSVYADLILIANNSVYVDSLTKEELQRIFLGKKVRWNHNLRIQIAAHKRSGSDAHEIFLKKYMYRTSKQYINWWRRMVYTGKGVYPRFFKYEKNLIHYVETTEGAIGYISSNIPHENVKTMKISSHQRSPN